MKVFRDFKTKNLVTPSQWDFWVELENGNWAKTLIVDSMDCTQEQYLEEIFKYHLKHNGFLTEDFRRELMELVLKAETVPGFYIGRTVDSINIGVAKQTCYHAWCYLDSSINRFLCFDCKVDLGDHFLTRNLKRKNKIGKLWTKEWRKREFFV